MDPDAPQPQPSEPTAPPETSDEDAPVVAPPPEPAPQTPQAPPPEQPDEDATFLPSGEPNEPLPPVLDATPPVVAPPEEDAPTPTAPLEPMSASAAPMFANAEPAMAHETDAPKSRTDMATLSRIGLAKRRKLKDMKMERLLALAASKKHLVVSEAQLLLRISKRTAEVYLNQLVALGHLERRGRVDSTEYWWRG